MLKRLQELLHDPQCDRALRFPPPQPPSFQAASSDGGAAYSQARLRRGNDGFQALKTIGMRSKQRTIELLPCECGWAIHEVVQGLCRLAAESTELICSK